MDELLDMVRGLGDRVAGVVSGLLGSGAFRGVSDAGLLEVLQEIGAIHRGADALLAEAAGEVAARSDSVDRAARLTTRSGCRSVVELVERATRVSTRTATDAVKAGAAIRPVTDVITGAPRRAEYPAIRDAVAAGAVGVDGVVAVASVLGSSRIGRAERDAADVELAAAASGTSADGSPPAGAEELRQLAQVWALWLDPDGAAPRDADASRSRSFTIGKARGGIVPVRGGLLVEVAAQLQLLFDCQLNPKVSGPPHPGGSVFREVAEVQIDPTLPGCPPSPEDADLRTRGQQQHDAFATLLMVAARAGELPTIGGAAPTLVVSVLHEDMASGVGAAHIDGCGEPVSLAVARQIACTGSIHRVTMTTTGRIMQIDVPDRVFTPAQRKAIALRDGGCVIPGCHVPAAWCEIHHIDDHAAGGPTHTDNGVMVCWHHHRTLDTSGWHIRTRHGIPEIRGPYWWDARTRWRPVTTSATRIRRQHAINRRTTPTRTE